MAVEPAGDDAALTRHLAALRPRLDLDGEALVERFWDFHPRFRFVKSLPWSSNLVDLGAGDGGLAHWRPWGRPTRPDLGLYGVDLQRGAYHALYTAWETVDLDRELPRFPGARFHGFLAAHLIEHLRDPERLIGWIAQRGEPASRIYLEWPNPETIRLPSRTELLRHGIDVVASNFRDDDTHRDCPEPAAVAGWLKRHGLVVIAQGAIDLGAVGEELYARAHERTLRTMGYWSITRWCVFVEAMKPG